MISEARLRDPKKTPIKHWVDVPALAERNWVFGPGLNVVWGPNGSGKSTLIRGIATTLHCAQGGISVVTGESVREVFPTHLSPPGDRFVRGAKTEDWDIFADGLEIVHDGKSVAFHDPGARIGLCAGGAAFDDDFMDEGLTSLWVKGSAGELAFDQLLRLLQRAKAREILWKVRKDRIGKHKVDAIEKVLAAHPESTPGRPTLLLDEPDRSLSLPKQRDLWRDVVLLSGRAQVIVATHSVFALPHVTHEMVEGYAESCRLEILALAKDLKNKEQENT